MDQDKEFSDELGREQRSAPEPEPSDPEAEAEALAAAGARLAWARYVRGEAPTEASPEAEAAARLRGFFLELGTPEGAEEVTHE